MSYHNKKILKYIVIYLFFCTFWLTINKGYLQTTDSIQKLYNLTSTHCGYNETLLTTSIFFVIYLHVLCDYLNLFCVNYLVRERRTKIATKCFGKMLVCSSIYSLTYVSVNVIFISVFIKQDLLLETGFYITMLLYMFSLIILYQFMGSVFLIMLTILRREYIAMLLCFVLHTAIAFLGIKYINLIPIYDDIGVVDMIKNYGMNLAQWVMMMCRDMLLVLLLFIVFTEIYQKKDMVKKVW